MRERLIERFGPAAGAWLDALPARAEALARRWDVVLDGSAPLDGGRTSVVLRGRLGDGRPVVLKLVFDPHLGAVEGDALAAWDTTGGGGAHAVSTAAGERRGPAAPADGACQAPPVPRLYARDDDAGALLLEAIEPGHPLAAGDAPADPAAIGGLLRALRAPPVPPGAEPLAARVDWCFELWLRRRADSERARTLVPDGALERGHRLTAELAADPSAPRAFVHGDLHPGNVLDGGRGRGLVAIDPRPCVGDPGWDAVDLALWGVADVAEARRRIAALAVATGDDPERLRAWCAGLAAMAAASLAARPAPPPPRRIALLLGVAA